MKTKVFIDGHEGTTGLRIHERLSLRDDITMISIDDSLRKDPQEVKKRLAEADIAFLCLPDAAAAEAAALAEGSKVRIIDTATIHRTTPGWVYGFPELSQQQRQAIATASRVGNPGCHAILIELLTDEGLGTMFVSPSYEEEAVQEAYV